MVVIAQERGKGEESLLRHFGRAFPEGFRKAQRAMSLAAKFQCPVVTFIDTPGAHPGLESEERGMGNAIASTMALMSDLPTPIIATIIGEGGSEGALALAVADSTIMMSNAIFTPISPERAALLLYRDQEKAEGVASALKLTAFDCKKLGIVDTTVPEPEGGAHADPEEAARRLSEALSRALLKVGGLSTKRLLRRRYKRFRNLGERSVYYRAAVRKEVSRLRRYIVKGVKGIARLRRRRRGEKRPSQGKVIKAEKK